MATIDMFAKRLTKLRETTGKKRQEVADSLNISRASLEYYEKGKRKPDIEILVKIADYYNVTCDYLLKGVKTENVNINEVIGLSDKAIDSLKLYQRLKKSRQYRNDFLVKKDECVKITNKIHDIDIISYFIERLDEYGILTLLGDIVTLIPDELIDFHIEDEAIDLNINLYNKRHSPRMYLTGYDYVRFLEQQAEFEFRKMIQDFRDELNPCDFEDDKSKFGYTQHSLLKLVEQDEEETKKYLKNTSIQFGNKGEKNGNDSETE